MFAAIFIYELKAWLRQPGFYLLAAAFFLLPLFLFLGTGGYFDGNSNDPTQGRLFINSSFQIVSSLHYVGKFLLFLLPAIMGYTIHKDIKTGVYTLIYSYPIEKRTYLGAKFSSAFFLVCLMAALPLLAFLSGEAILGAGSPSMTATDPTGYFLSYGFILFPNLLVFGLFVFSVVLLFRNSYAGFLLILLLLGLQFIVENFFPASGFFTALFDPFGQFASLEQAQYWTLKEKNTLSLQGSAPLIYNRLLWLGIGAGIAFLTYRQFRFHQFGWRLPLFQKNTTPTARHRHTKSKSRVLDLQLGSGFTYSLFQLYTLVRHNSRYILRHWIFLSFAVMGVLLLLFILNGVLHSRELVMLPLTRLILQVPALLYTMLLVFATFLFSGMLVFREKEAGMEPLIYSTGTSTTLLILSKAISLILIQLVLLFLLMVTGVVIQTFHGFYTFDFPQYFFSVFLLQAPVLAVWALLSVFVFSLTRNVYVGLFFLLLFWIAQYVYDPMGITTRLLQFNTYPLLDYSDLAGYGPDLQGRLILQLYWFLWGLLLLIFALLLWPRVQTGDLKGKWAFLKRNTVPGIQLAVACLILALGLLAYPIYRAEKATFQPKQSQKVLTAFQDTFGFLKNRPQPRITSVSIQLDLFPEQQAFTAEGQYQLINKTKGPIDSIFVKTSIDEITRLTLARAHKVDSFPALRLHVYHLEDPLLPGDSLPLSFHIRHRPNTLFQKNSNVLSNGSFLTQDILPRIGYFLPGEAPCDAEASVYNNHYQSWDSDLVRYEATLSTAGDQRAFTNGRLRESWTKSDRNYFFYRSSEPIKFNFHFTSGTFDVYHEEWENTAIFIYHHPDHRHNLQAIAGGVKEALAFHANLFGRAPEEEITIIEYALHQGSFNTLKSRSLLLSESLFGVNASDTSKINLPFYVAAHEMTHHWFGNQLIPKEGKGALFLTESITEYLTLQIFKKRFGEATARNFLKVQQSRYFRGRANATGEESPLAEVTDGQEYLSYGKGAVVLHTIAHALGEDTFHRFLSTFFTQQAGPGQYPCFMDFMDPLKTVAPDPLHSVIDELLLQSITYKLELHAADVRQQETEGVIDLRYSIQAFDGDQPLSPAHPRTFELGVYDEQGELLQLFPVSMDTTQARLRLENGTATPHLLRLDPNYLALDWDRKDNELVLK